MVEIEIEISRPIVEFQYGGRFGKSNGMPSHSHLSHCMVLPLGESIVLSWSQSHMAHCTCRVLSAGKFN